LYIFQLAAMSGLRGMVGVAPQSDCRRGAAGVR
jgi:hypothetical protein